MNMMKQTQNKSVSVPNNYAGFLTLLQAMGLLALFGLALAWIGCLIGS